MTELKNCPFCGGEAQFKLLSNFSNSAYVGFTYTIQCSECGCSPIKNSADMYIFLNEKGEVVITDASIGIKQSMIDEWNTRAVNESDKEI